MGIDLEKIDDQNADMLKTQISDAETIKFKAVGLSFTGGATLVWTVKEALSKIFKTGLMDSFNLYEIEQIKKCEGHMTGFFMNFPQYQFISFMHEGYICSIVYPVKCQLHTKINIETMFS